MFDMLTMERLQQPTDQKHQSLDAILDAATFPRNERSKCDCKRTLHSEQSEVLIKSFIRRTESTCAIWFYSIYALLLESSNLAGRSEFFLSGKRQRFHRTRNYLYFNRLLWYNWRRAPVIKGFAACARFSWRCWLRKLWSFAMDVWLKVPWVFGIWGCARSPATFETGLSRRACRVFVVAYWSSTSYQWLPVGSRFKKRLTGNRTSRIICIAMNCFSCFFRKYNQDCI